jgi:AraC-like DNA-binding protein
MAFRGRPGHSWTLDELARESASSRSDVARQFALLVGQPPMQYLTRWRMQDDPRLATPEQDVGTTSHWRNYFPLADWCSCACERALTRMIGGGVGMSPDSNPCVGGPGTYQGLLEGCEAGQGVRWDTVQLLASTTMGAGASLSCCTQE